jgi:uncharacterized membrane protein
METREFLDQLDDPRIVAAIRDAEGRTTGEIRVFVTARAVTDPLTPAKLRFEKLGMAKTREHNAVLLYFAPETRRFAVVGDRGIHEKCDPAFWAETVAEIGAQLRSERFTDAVVLGVRKVGDLLARYFPGDGGKNELPDEIERG